MKNIYSQEMLSAVQMRQSGKGKVFKQELKEKEFRKFKFFSTGQVALQAFYDSDQFAGVLQDAIALFPLEQNIDSTGLDINDKNQFSMFALNASVKSLFVGPDVWGAKMVGRFEVGFSGLNSRAYGIMNISNIYISMLWNRTELRFGHYFHPLALSTTYPTPVSGTEGAGFDPVRKVGVIRFTHLIDNYKIFLAISKVFAREEARRAAVPDLFCEFEMTFRKKYKMGVGFNYHVEVPRLFSQVPPAETGLDATAIYKTPQQVGSIAAFVFARLLPKPFLLKLRATYIENGLPFGIMGSYSVQYRNEVTDERIYTPMRTLACWADLVYLGSKRVEPAIFIGFSKGLGAKTTIVKGFTYTGENDEEQDVSLISLEDPAKNMQYLFQISPRLRMRAKNFIFGFEIGYTRAAFARNADDQGWRDDYDCRGKIIDAVPTSNTRVIFSAIYAF